MSSRELPASVGQRLLWLMGQYRGGAVLNCPLVCRIRGPVAPAQIGIALDRLTARHEALRTTVHRVGRRLVQRVHDASAAPASARANGGQPESGLAPAAASTAASAAGSGYASLDSDGAGTATDIVSRTSTAIAGDSTVGGASINGSTSANANASVADIEALLRAELRTPIDPEAWPVRARLWRVGVNDHVLCVNVHHVVTDAWSGALLFTELSTLMADGVSRAVLRPVGWQYAEFSQWQEQFLQSAEFVRQRDYWSRQLAGSAPAPIGADPLTLDPAVARQTASHTLALAPGTFAAANAWAHGHRTTVFAVLLAAFYGLLHDETEQTDLAVTSVFANRASRELRDTVGFIANPVVLRTRLDPAASFEQLVQATHATVTDAFVYQAVPFHLLPGLDGPRGGRRPDDVVFQMMPAPMQAARRGQTAIDPLVPDAIASRFALELAVVARGREADVVLFYDTGRFDGTWAQAWLRRYVALVTAAVADPRQRLQALLARRAEVIPHRHGVGA